MSDFPSFQDLFNVARDEMLSRNGNLTLDIITRQGTDANVMTAGMAAVGDEVVGQLAIVQAGLFYSTAKGQQLDRLVFDRTGLTRKPASAALGSVVFSLATPNPGSFSIPSRTRLATSDGRQYVTTVTATFATSATSTPPIAIRSVLAGSSQQAAAGSIASIIDKPSGAPATPALTVTNALATAGAGDTESDDALVARAQAFFTTARRGTLAAIEQGALAVPGVQTATAIENTDQFGRPAKSVQLIVTDQFTDSLVNVSPTPATYQTQSQVLVNTVFAALSDVRAAGIDVQPIVAAIVLLNIILTLSFTADANPDEVALNARAAIVAYVNGLSAGESFVVSDAIQVLRSISGLVVSGQEIYSPAGNIVPGQLQAIRTSLLLVQAVSLQPDKALQGSTNPDLS